MTNRIAVMGVVAAVGCAAALGEVRTYEVEISSHWTTMTHPGAFPNNAHLTPFAGAVHNADVSLWSVGALATPGLKQLAETGSNGIFANEAQAAVDAGDAFAVIQRTRWVCPPQISHSLCGTGMFEIEVDSDYPLVTLASMIGPSPDWFVGLVAEPMMVDGGWVIEKSLPMHPYDGGTRSNDDSFALFGPLNDPPQPVSLITDETGQLIGGQSIGTFTFRLKCPADLNGSGDVDGSDLAVLLAAWGQPGGTDLNQDGTTNGGDLAVLLAAWGTCE